MTTLDEILEHYAQMWSGFEACQHDKLDKWLEENVTAVKLKQLCRAYIVEPAEYGRLLRMLLARDKELAELSRTIINELHNKNKDKIKNIWQGLGNP